MNETILKCVWIAIRYNNVYDEGLWIPLFEIRQNFSRSSKCGLTG